MKIVMRLLAVSLSSILLFLCLAAPASALNTMISYEQYPSIVTEPTKPNVLIMISNDWTGFTKGYHEDYKNTVDYWGYFDSRKEYEYKNSGQFSPKGTIGANHYTTSNSYWSGNFLNWVTMSNADFLRKALTGGRRTNDVPYGTTLIRGDIPTDRGWKKSYSGADLNRLVPSTYAVSGYLFSNTGTTMDIIGNVTTINNKGKKVTTETILDTLSVLVETCTEALPEKNCTTYQPGSRPEGLLQRYKEKMLFGLMSYSHNKFDQGGILRQPIADISDYIAANGAVPSNSVSMLRYIDTYTNKDYDPLAEMFYDGVRYLRGNTAAQKDYCPVDKLGKIVSSDDGFNFYGCEVKNAWVDPVDSWCQKNSIVIINDEYPSREHDKIPHSPFNSGYRDDPIFAAGNEAGGYNPDVVALLAEITQLEGLVGTEGLLAEKVGDPNTNCRTQTIDNLANFKGICPSQGDSQGTFSLAALAYDAFKNDMRPDYENKQSFRTYAIAFRASDVEYKTPKIPLNPMYLAGKYGNFDDMNDNGVPDLDEEWMKGAALCDKDFPNDNCLPKGFFYADGGDKIEKALEEVVESILRRSASGTAVSVLATSGQGDGNLVQAYYRPKRLVPTADGVPRDVAWTGYLQSLWIDKYGNMREDTDNNQQLDFTKDKIIKFLIDPDGSTKVSRFAVSSDTPFPATNYTSSDQIELGDIKVVWEAGKRLAATASADRNIFTGIDLNFDGVVGSGEFLPFTTASTAIRPYLALQDGTPENGYDELGKEEDTRINNLIAFIRGDDPRTDPAPTSFIDTGNTKMRDRRIGGEVWKLGDIINSTPISLAAPPDRFDLIYGDASYGDFYNLYKNRETVVYVGANDGMLHAFTSWQYNKTTQKFEDPDTASNKPIGSELWAYIPQSLLPHLKWLTRPEYTHVFYMDMQPRIFDARIFAVDAAHPHGWGTVMVVGMNTGGGLTTVNGDFNGTGTLVRRDFNPSYMAFDITEPRNPKLLWERAYDGLGFTRSIPTVMRVEDATESKWFLVFGNGPDAGTLSAGTDPNYKGESITNGRIYIVDLATGAPYTTISPAKDWWTEVDDPRAFFNAPTAYDRYLNFSVDAAYMATTYNNQANSNQPADWKGSVYRILTLDSTAVQTVPTYTTDPTQWSLQKLFNSPRPITAPGALSIDHNGSTWAYFGTGRYLNNKAGGDKNTMDQEYLIGIKDPFFNKSYAKTDPAYYQNFDANRLLEVENLLAATPIAVLTTGFVKCYSADPVSYSDPVFDLTLDTNGFLPAGRQPCPAATGTASTFNNLLSFARAKDGWIKALPLGDKSAERSLNKPAVIGGLVLFSTFLPTGDDCSYGGESTLYVPYYETGTAFKKAVFQGGKGVKLLADGSGDGRILDSYSLGDGSTSSVGVHLGQQNDNADSSLSGDMATGFVQQGSGNIIDFDFETAIKVRSGMRSWVERN